MLRLALSLALFLPGFGSGACPAPSQGRPDLPPQDLAGLVACCARCAPGRLPDLPEQGLRPSGDAGPVVRPLVPLHLLGVAVVVFFPSGYFRHVSLVSQSP